jgi:NitT/TauT family transport system substrate-binding protein
MIFDRISRLFKTVSIAFSVAPLAVAIVACGSDASVAADGALTKLIVGYGANSPQYSELFVARDLGLFKKYGLDVELKLYNSSGQAPAVLTSGSVNIAGGTASSFAVGISKGLEMSWIGVTMPKWPLVMWAKNSIQSVAELKGKRIGITSPGSLGSYATNAVLATGGLKPADVEIVTLGDLTGLLAGMREGRVDAILINPPLGEQTASGGTHAIYDAAQLPNASLSYAVMNNWYAKNTDTVVKFLAAVADAIDMLRSSQNKEQLKQVVGKATNITDPQQLEISYNYYSKLLDPKMTMDVDQFKDAFRQANDTSNRDVTKYLNSDAPKKAAELRGK